MTSPTQARRRQGFTLIELLIVIGIIVLLVAILLPAVNHVRIQAYNASTQSRMSNIMAACQMYFHDFNSYPGPIANTYLAGGAMQGQTPVPIQGLSSKSVTSSENLVLGLFGFLTPPTAASAVIIYPYTNPITPPTHDVLSLNPLHPASYHYMDYNPTELTSTTGLAGKDVATYQGQNIPDTNVPEFVDAFPDPLPIIYLRANAGNGPAPKGSSTSNPLWVSPDDTSQYNTKEIDGTGGTGIYGSSERYTPTGGQFLKFSTQSFTTLDNDYTSQKLADDEAVPYAGYWPPTASSITNPVYYFMNPNILNAVRGKDGFILMSAGMDRTYGTLDDIIVTP